MQRTGQSMLFWAALLLCGSGCRFGPASAPWSFGAQRPDAAGPSVTPIADLDPELQAAPPTPRAGSAIAGGAGQPAAPGGAASVDAVQLVQILEELDTLDLSPEQRAQFREDLKQADPAYWPMMVQTLRTTLAYREQQEERVSEPAAELAADESVGPRYGSPGNWTPRPRTPVDDVQLAATPTRQPNTEVPQPRLLADSGEQELHPWPTEPARLPVTPAGGMVDQAAQPLAQPAPTQAAPYQQAQPVGVDLASHTDNRAAASAQNTWAAIQNPQASLAPAALGQTAALAGGWESGLQQTIAALEEQLRVGDGSSTEEHVRLRMLYLLAGRRDEAMRPMPGLAATEQEYWSQQLYALATYLDEERQADGSQRAAAAASILDQATARLEDLSPLEVRNLAFCTEVVSFGVYKKFSKYHFQPGQQLLLYAEVDNFKSEATPEGYHTALRSSYRIYDAAHRLVEEHEFDLTEEHCQNQRRDFFIRYFLYLPAQIYDGEYSLQLTIEDTIGRKVGQSTIQFTVAAP